MQTNIKLTEVSEQHLLEIQLSILKATGKKLRSKEDLINASIAIAKGCLEFIDEESIKNYLKELLTKN